MKKISLLILLTAAIIGSCFAHQKPGKSTFSIPYKQYKLENGLDVILHQDKSDPLVAVAIQYHVGSNREEPGKTGFAHLFEHMMFQESENIGKNQYFSKVQGAGGTLNGGTGNDGTVYYEIVPQNALELVLWMESDRMGFFRNSVTQKSFVTQQNVVLNEKRQSEDNKPYGFNNWLIAKNLYPKGHPYSWTVIGEMADLTNATVDDVKAFHAKYYVPNNATLVISGNFDETKVKSLVQKYFGEIPQGRPVSDLPKMPVQLQETKKVFHEDNYASTPQLTLVWPVAELFSDDSYALNFLARFLGNGKKSTLSQLVVDEKKLAGNVDVYNNAMELAGQFTISAKANPDISLATLENVIFEAFEKFEKQGITASDMERIKARLETDFYNTISTAMGKAYRLAFYNEYAGSPSFIQTEIRKIQSVTVGDVMRVYEKYIRNKPYLATSFVPKGKTALVAEGSVNAGIVEEKGSVTAKNDQIEAGEETIVKTPSKFDRSVEPALGADPEFTLPKIWTAKTFSGIQVSGIEQNEVPLIQYSLVIEGGHIFETVEKSGTAALLAKMLMEGTARKTSEELEETIQLLGAGIKINGGREDISINVNALSENFEKTLTLVKEMLLEPRWDEEKFKVEKMKMINETRRNSANPNYMAALSFYKIIYGGNSVLGIPPTGTVESLESITMDDLKAFYNSYFSPAIARFHIAGNVAPNRVKKALEQQFADWKYRDVVKPELKTPAFSEKGEFYFVDVPDAKQSVIYMGYTSINRGHRDFFPVTAMNHKLGGSFSSNLNMVLREQKGFTYSVRSGFAGFKHYGNFTASTSVRSDATLEAVEIIRSEIEKYRQGISEEDLKFTRNSLLKSKCREYETLGALLNVLQEIGNYQLPVDFIKQEESFLKNYTAEMHKELALKYLDPSKMCILVAGDAKTQIQSLEKLGLGIPVLLNPNTGNMADK
jgi:zinc protease